MSDVTGHISAARDAWLSEVMAREVYRVTGILAQGGETQARQDLRDITELADFCYARVPTHELRTCEIMEQGGFSIVDTGVTLEARAFGSHGRSEGRVRRALPADRTAVERIARESFRYSRFHLDPHVPRQIANEVKAQWAGNFFSGKRGDAMVVAERGGEVAGFAQLLRAPEKALVVDLIAVAEAHRGCGLAEEMMRFAVDAGEQPEIVRVGTQIANVASLALYQKVGFRIVSSSYLFHYHKVSR